MKRKKFTKTNLEKLPHPTGKTPVRYFATNCSHLCIRVQPQPSLVKSYYAQWSKIIMQADGKQKRTGRYKYICRVGDKPIEAVIAEVKLKLKELDILKHNYYHLYNEFAPKERQRFLDEISN